jgi:hypothetical protein
LNFKTLARCNCILQIDILGKVRAGKIMLYDRETEQ